MKKNEFDLVLERLSVIGINLDRRRLVVRLMGMVWPIVSLLVVGKTSNGVAASQTDLIAHAHKLEKFGSADANPELIDEIRALRSDVAAIKSRFKVLEADSISQNNQKKKA
jgi:hypothetical protein